MKCYHIFFNLLFIIISAPSFAQVEVQSLYDRKSRTPGRIIPFRVVAEKGAAIVQDVQLDIDNNVDCRWMIDPYRKNIIWLKCLSEALVNLSISALNEKTVYEIKYGPVDVSKPGNSLVIIDQDTTSNNAKILAGKQLFNVHCIGCHNPPKLKSGRSIEQIKTSVDVVDSMKSLAPVLSTKDYENLAIFLGSL